MVQFMPLGDRITASAGEHGRITGAMAGGTEQVGNIASGFTLAEGASVTFTAEPDTGYEMEQWSVNGTPVSGETDNTYTYTAGSAGAVITVAFRPVEYTVRWTAEHGTVTADEYSGSAASIRGGTQVTFTAAPHNGYVFDHWTIDGETLTNETATLRWTVPTGQEATMEYAIEAVFTENTTTYSVTYDASGGGTITAEGHEASPATVTYGQSITFTAVPAEYGYVKEWRVDGVPVPNSSNKTSYTLENVTQAHTVTVVFATAVRYDVSYAVNGDGGTLSAAADGTELALSAGQQASVAGGSRLVFAAVPSSGMMTGHWTVNDIAVTRENMSSLGVTMDHCLSNTLTIESLSRNVEVKAAFAEYSGFSIPTGGPGYEIFGVKRLPADTLPDTEIRAGGDVTFTVRPTAEYSDFSKLTVNGYDCLTGSGKAADCETVSARKNADGSYMQVDWAGDTAAVIDTDTGEIIPAYVFVATLPYSGYSYVETFFSMNQESWTTAHVNAYKYFGGVTRIIQCDDLKTGVQKHGKDEVVLNKSYQELALLIKHTTTYKGLKPLYSEYKKSRDKEKYLRGREREIILFEASAWALKAAGVGDKLPDLGKLREEYSRLSEEKDRLYAEYGSLKKRMREYDAVKQNIDSILSPNRGQEQDKAL